MAITGVNKQLVVNAQLLQGTRHVDAVRRTLPGRGVRHIEEAVLRARRKQRRRIAWRYEGDGTCLRPLGWVRLLPDTFFSVAYFEA